MGRKRLAAMQQAWEGGGEVKEPEAVFAVALSILIGFCIAVAAYFTGWESGHQTRKEAVQRGFAAWVSDENGNTHFEWKEPAP